MVDMRMWWTVTQTSRRSVCTTNPGGGRMSTMGRMTTGLLALPIVEWSPPLPAAGDYPIKRWVQVKTEHRFRGYAYSSSVYVPDRGQILHWGAIRNIHRAPLENRDDMLAFDPDRGDWVSDYPSTPDLNPSYSIGQTGIGTSIRGTAEMVPDGRPTPSMVVNAVCYDSRRKQVVYAMKGLTAAYDRQTRRWTDLKSSTGIHGRTYPGGPLVYGAGTAYDPEDDEIVMFGGRDGIVRTDLEPGRHLGSPPGAFNDTWLYDVASRRWRELQPRRRPPPAHLPNLLFDTASDTVFLVTFTEQSRDHGPATSRFWTLDIEQSAWHRRLHVDLPFDLAYEHTYASKTPLFSLGYDPARRLLVLVQDRREDLLVTQDSFAMHVDFSAMPSEPAPLRAPAPPVQPIEWPEPDPAHERRLRELPANEWVKLEPRPGEELRRDWGNVALDPVENRFCCFGGGHAPYQVNDVAIYDVGSNTWIHGVGEHNDLISPIGWGGMAMGLRGGHHAHHQRNEYQAVAGRMYVSVGGTKGYVGWGSADRQPGVSWFYDANEGGVWRIREVQLDLGPGVGEPYGEPHMSHADGKIHSRSLEPEHRYARKPKAAYYCVFDATANRPSVRAIPRPWPLRVGEMRDFCLLPDRRQIIYYEHTEARDEEEGRQRLWRHEIETERFTLIDSPQLPPPGRMPTLEYLAGQDALLAVIQPEGRLKEQRQQWIFRLGADHWEQLPLKGANPTLQTPYGQMAYVRHCDVLIKVARETTAMRVDLRQ